MSLIGSAHAYVACLMYHHVSEVDLVSIYAPLKQAALHKQAELDATYQRACEDAERDGEALPPQPVSPLAVFTFNKARFRVETVANLIITPHWAFESVPAYNILVIPGGAGVRDTLKRDKITRKYLERTVPKLGQELTHIIALNEGVFLLGELGLLRNLDTTAPLASQNRLRDYEVGSIMPEGLVKNPSGIWCASGATAGSEAAQALLKPWTAPSSEPARAPALQGGEG